MSLLFRILEMFDSFFPARTAYAHCDIPCGIYDPHLAQMAAHTVIRMVTLINELKSSSMPEEEKEHMLSRYTSVKEHHAELCKQEIRILWGDYFKPEHIEKYPDLHELVWKAMKLGSKAKQEVNPQAAEELLETANRIAEIFWKTKGIETTKAKATFYPTGKETTYPTL